MVDRYFIKQSPEYELRVLLQSLLGNIEVNSVAIPVFQAVPRQLARPYIVIDGTSWTVDADKHYDIDDWKVLINVYTDEGDTLQNSAIMNGVVMALTGALTTHVDGSQTGLFQFSEESVFRIGMMFLEGGDLTVIGNNELFPELLEQSTLTMAIHIEQTRGQYAP